MQSDPRNARPARRLSAPVQFAFVLIAASGMAASAQNAPGAGGQMNANQPNANQVNAVTSEAIGRAERLVIPLSNAAGIPLRVENPNAFSSRAWDTTVGSMVPAERLPQHVVYGTVIVVAESRAAVAAGVAKLQGDFPWLNPNMIVESENIDGVYTIDVRTVRNALRIAERLRVESGIIDTSLNVERPHQRHGGDPALVAQWHIENTLNPGNDHRIAEVHADDITGKGVVVGILEAFRGSFNSPYDPDDLAVPGFDFSSSVHPDLFDNFRQNLSQQTDPFQVEVTHETAVAGIVGAVANNGIFGRGVAFDAGLAALRNGSAIEAADAWTHQLNSIHIINNSWGPVNITFPPDTTGLVPTGPDPEDVNVRPPEVSRSQPATIQELAIQQGLNLGRNNKGRIYVFSAGNGNHFQGWDRFLIGNAASLPQHGFLDIVTDTFAPGNPFDFFALDGSDDLNWRYSGMMGDRTEYWPIATKPNVFAIGAVGESNQLAGYSTTGTGLFASAYSLGTVLPQNFDPVFGYVGDPVGRGITTTYQIGEGSDPNCPGFLQIDGLTCSFSGTSAAAPVAAGIMALMLEANPDLTTRDIKHIIQRTAIPLNFDPVGSYWTTVFGFGQTDPDATTEPPTFWQANSADVLHSDEYGFGLIDAAAAVEKARTWPGLPKLFVLDSGLIEIEDLTIPDAEFIEVGADPDETAPKVFHIVLPGERVSAGRELPSGVTINGLACVRENFRVEAVEVTLTISGVGPGDLFIVLESPRGSVSPLAIPRADSSEFAYTNYTFTTYKHWGELSSGTWNIYFQDFRPDEETPIGTLPDEDDPGEEHITYFGPLGMPGANGLGFPFPSLDHTEKTVVSARLRIFGTETDLEPNLACPPILTSCPGDLNGDGIIDTADLQLFFEWFLAGDLRADMNGDGQLTFDDVVAYRALWIPGFCNRSGPVNPSGRPIGPSNPSPNNPTIRPI
ncbi:MAG: S8 family serine peptidase [Phycisphaerales bacterium]|nr:S8 family serine peptidase [Planctomycetota bacterium]MCH8508280.1 S8 family serine peptidase [Phycisphaerales bacterium]